MSLRDTTRETIGDLLDGKLTGDRAIAAITAMDVEQLTPSQLAGAVDAVMEVVEAAAATTGQTISTHLLRLLHKFAQHAEGDTEASGREADTILRENVVQLIRNWELDDPNPGAYTAVLEGMVRQTPAQKAIGPGAISCDAELVVQMALETGCSGPRSGCTP